MGYITTFVIEICNYYMNKNNYLSIDELSLLTLSRFLSEYTNILVLSSVFYIVKSDIIKKKSVIYRNYYFLLRSQFI